MASNNPNLPFTAEETLAHIRRLADASLAINQKLSLRDILQEITFRAAQVVGSHQAMTTLTEGDRWCLVESATYLSEKYNRFDRSCYLPGAPELHELLCREKRPVRLTQPELEAHPVAQAFRKNGVERPPARGCL